MKTFVVCQRIGIAVEEVGDYAQRERALRAIIAKRVENALVRVEDYDGRIVDQEYVTIARAVEELERLEQRERLAA